MCYLSTKNKMRLLSVPQLIFFWTTKLERSVYIPGVVGIGVGSIVVGFTGRAVLGETVQVPEMYVMSSIAMSPRTPPANIASKTT